MIDTLIDTGPLLAIVARIDRHHEECARLIRKLDCAFYTTAAVLTEIMYLSGKRIGHVAQQSIWEMVFRGDLEIIDLTLGDYRRMQVLMAKYADRPMDFADASLVAIAERLSIDRVFTVDRADFSVYKLHGRKAFTIIGP